MATNPQLKRAHAVDEFTPDMIGELIRCKNDPIYFIRNYVKVQHQTKGAILFDLYPYQEDMINHFQGNKFSCVMASRQMGKTVTAAMYLLWYGTFHQDKLILIASKNQNHAMEIAGRVRFAYENLPSWIKCGLKYYNRHMIEFDNGSRIVCEATTENTGRGLAIAKLYLDELAFINPRIQTELWASLTPTLSTGGSAIISSTPNGDTDLFASLWRAANTAGDGKPGSNGYAPFLALWHQHPDRGPEYWDEMVAKLGPVVTAQEVGCEFVSSDALLINSIKLAQLRSSQPIYEDMGFKFWEEEEKIGGGNKIYLVGVDPATGSGKDYSVIQIFEFPAMRQIAEWRSNEINIPLLYAKIKWVLNMLTRPVYGARAEVIWTFERNGVGEAVAALYMNDEAQPEYAELYNEDTSAKRYGVYTGGKNKVLACLQLKTFVEKVSGGMTVNSQVLLDELKNFVARGDTYKAKDGAHDDTVMAVIIVIRLLKRLSEYNDDAFKQVNEYIDPTGNQEGGWDEPLGFVM